MFDILHAQSDPFAPHIDFYDTDADVLMEADDLRGVGDEAVGEPGDVDQSVLVDSDVDESPEVGDVRHDAREFHPHGEVAGGVDVLVELEGLDRSARVASGFFQFIEDVFQAGQPDAVWMFLRSPGEAMSSFIVQPWSLAICPTMG